jgi:hypothetical protein
MDKFIRATIVCCVVVFFAATLAGAQSPTATVAPTAAPVVKVVSVYFPNEDQTTGVWQGCGPTGNNGNMEAFNLEHPRARIVQVFVDASLTCGVKTYGFVIVYQNARVRPSRKAR